MSTIAKVFAGGFIFIGILALWLSGNYNSLVSSKVQVEKAWSKVETQYQRRFDLVDNLVATVKSAQMQEKDVFVKIAQARTAYNNAGSINEKTDAVSSLETNIALIPRLQEAYPELKSNSQVTMLMTNLTSTEDSILKARDSFNDTASNYNQNITQFPKNIFALVFKFEKQNLFKADSGASKAVKVQF